MIAKMWKFSPTMVKMIRHHHLPDEAMIKDKNLAVVYLADCICLMMGIGGGADGLAYRFNDQVMAELGIGPDDISVIIADFIVNVKEVEDLLNVV